MNLYVVRHGESEANAMGVLQGPALDYDLTSEGVAQIESVRFSLPEEIGVMYSSPLKRVVQSAEILNKNFNVEILKRDALKERDYGTLAGKAWEDIENGAELLAIDEEMKYDYRPFGGESVEQVRARVEAVLEEIKNINHNNVLIVTSRGPVRQFYHILENRIEPNVPNGSLHVFEL